LLRLLSCNFLLLNNCLHCLKTFTNLFNSITLSNTFYESTSVTNRSKQTFKKSKRSAFDCVAKDFCKVVFNKETTTTNLLLIDITKNKIIKTRVSRDIEIRNNWEIAKDFRKIIYLNRKSFANEEIIITNFLFVRTNVCCNIEIYLDSKIKSYTTCS